MFHGKNMLVLGAARSGVAAARVLHGRGARVTVTDKAPLQQLDAGAVKALEVLGVPLIAGGHPLELLSEVHLIVKNPGIPPDIGILKTARSKEIPVISELELAYLVTGAEIVAVTGTNGKTTTTALAGELFAQGRRPSAVGGNIGLPLCSISDGKSEEWILVAEVSSFQLEDCYQFRPAVAVYTNISPDHLDRHKTMENYVAAKFRLQQKQTAADYVIMNLDDPGLRQMPRGNAREIGYSLTPDSEAVCYIREGFFCWRDGRCEEKLAPLENLKIPGKHNRQNALAAIAAARVMGMTAEEIAAGLLGFAGVEHRLEYAGQAGGVKFINDSKATNPQSAIIALQSFEPGVLLLAGGYDKGADFSEFAAVAAERASVVCCYGQTAGQLAADLKKAGMKEIKMAGNLEEAFTIARRLAEPGDVVLLSPACASWDQYASFEDRGKHFKDLVSGLEG